MAKITQFLKWLSDQAFTDLPDQLTVTWIEAIQAGRGGVGYPAELWKPSWPAMPSDAVVAAANSAATADAWLVTWQTTLNRNAAKSTFQTSTDALYKLLRCQSDIIRQQLNTLGDVIGTASQTWDAPNIANAAGATSPNFTVTGAAFGDFVDVGAPVSLAGLTCTGFVSAANTVNVRLHNGTGGAVNLASGTWRVVVRRQPGTRTLAQLRTAIENLIDGGTLD